MKNIGYMFWVNLAIMLIFITSVNIYWRYSGFFYWFIVFFIAIVGMYFVTMTTKYDDELSKYDDELSK